MGPWGGLVTGAAETIEYVATTAVVVFFSAAYLDFVTAGLLNFSLAEQNLMWIWWIVLYVAFVGLNAAGAHISFRFAIVVSIISIAIILLFSVMALTSGLFSFDKLWDMVPNAAAAGSSVFLPEGWFAILFALPFAMWFFLGIEALPLAAEESHTPERDIPRAGVLARGTLIVTGLLVLFLNTGVLGAEATGVSLEPLVEGFAAIVGNELAAVIAIFALIGLLASLHGIMFAYGRNMYSLSRAGYYPKFLSLTGKNQTPWVALTVGAVVGFIALVVLDTLSKLDPEGVGVVAGAIILNIAVWGAVVAYFLQMVSFIILRRKFPNVNRPYKSPMGLFGAYSAAAIAALVFVGLLLNPAFQAAIVAIIVVYALMLLGFAVHYRKQLVLSPEEEYAMSGGTHELTKE
jgi:ethanolamine permease